jgi:16S rRNA processing protein RimM
MAPNWEEMALVGRIARPVGVRGQMVVDVDTDFPHERFHAGAELFVRRGGSVEPLIITTIRFQRARPVIGIRGVDDMTAAKAFAGAELRIPVERLARLPHGTFYRHDLIGCQVQTDGGDPVGTVVNVEGSMGGSRLVVDAARGEVLVPLAAAFVPLVDPLGKLIVIAPPEGLLELNERPAGKVRRGADR